MTDALEDRVGTVSIRGRTVTNLRFADDLPGGEQELVILVSRLDKTSGMEISAEKTKLMTNNISGINKKINVSGQILETTSSTWVQLSQRRDPNLRLFQGLPKQQ